MSSIAANNPIHEQFENNYISADTNALFDYYNKISLNAAHSSSYFLDEIEEPDKGLNDKEMSYILTETLHDILSNGFLVATTNNEFKVKIDDYDRYKARVCVEEVEDINIKQGTNVFKLVDIQLGLAISSVRLDMRYTNPVFIILELVNALNNI